MIKDRLKDVRDKTGMNKKEFAEYIGIKYTTYNNYETGAREPDSEFLIMISKKFDVSTDFILGLQDDREILHSYELRASEYERVKQYRSLDDFGKERIDYELKKECERVKELEELKKKFDVEFSSEIVPIRSMAYYQRMASAGSGEYLFSDIPTNIIEVPDTPLSRRANFVLGVNGHSMETTFFDGDNVLVEKTNNVPIGEIGVFIREGECFIKEAGKDRLISHNEDKEKYPDIIPDEREINTVGVVLGRVGE